MTSWKPLPPSGRSWRPGRPVRAGTGTQRFQLAASTASASDLGSTRTPRHKQWLSALPVFGGPRRHIGRPQRPGPAGRHNDREDAAYIKRLPSLGVQRVRLCGASGAVRLAVLDMGLEVDVVDLSPVGRVELLHWAANRRSARQCTGTGTSLETGPW